MHDYLHYLHIKNPPMGNIDLLPTFKPHTRRVEQKLLLLLLLLRMHLMVAHIAHGGHRRR